MKADSSKKIKKPLTISPKKGFQRFIENFKNLEGDPHYVSRGMAIGVFIGVTPTIPFHLILALIFAFIFKGSKPAAVVGIWFCNPATIPIFYIGSYKLGLFLTGEVSHDIEIITALLETLEGPIPFSEKCQAILNFMEQELHSFYLMIFGGFVLGIIPGIASYFITFKIVSRMRSEESKS